MDTIEEFKDHVVEMVEDVGHNLEPDEDWIPVLICFGKDPAIFAIPQLGDPQFKDKACEIAIPTFIKQAMPDFVALVCMGWGVEYDRTSVEGLAEQARDEAQFAPGDISHRASRYEVLTIHIVAKDGDERQLFGYVHRHTDSPPTVQWRDDLYEGGKVPPGKSGGRFPDALRAGMEAAWKK